MLTPSFLGAPRHASPPSSTLPSRISTLACRLRRITSALLLGALAFGTAAATAQAAQGTSATPSASAHPVVLLQTSQGPITLQLDAQKAPKTVANFIAYVDAKHYDGTLFHRVIPGFMIQGGGFDTHFKEKPTRAPIALEAANGLHNTRGTIAMARTSDPDSATAQFFINTNDNANLDYPEPDGHGYAVFGKVIKGIDTVDRIAAQPTGSHDGMADVPLTPVIIDSAKVLSR